MVRIPVPSQARIHKQWCIFDQTENIDFDQEVRNIIGDAGEVTEDDKGIDEEKDKIGIEINRGVRAVEDMRRKEKKIVVKSRFRKNLTQRVTENVSIVRMTKEISRH